MTTNNLHPSGVFGRVVALAACLVVAVASTAAHDLWIEPSTFSPEAGKIVGVGLRVGQDLLGDPIARDPALIERFIAVDSAGERPLVGRDGANPAGLLRVAGNGLIVIGYLSKPTPIVLAPDKFNQYLSEEGLDTVVALRKERREWNSSAREMFSRCAKSLVLAGPATATETDRVLGFTLELVAEKNPYVLTGGQELPVHLLFRNAPLAGALVVAVKKGNPAARLSARSGQDGRVKFRLPEPGAWLIKAVHMTPAPAGSDSQWASFWASLTFHLPGDSRAGEGSR